MPVPDPYAALRIPEYRRFITARVFITIAIQIQAVVVGWQVYELTKDPLSLGLIGLAEAAPSIAVSLLGAGHVADFVHRKKNHCNHSLRITRMLSGSVDFYHRPRSVCFSMGGDPDLLRDIR